MKPTQLSHYLKFALFLLAILCSSITTYAYDFEVDGIYYNITSTNTVEVTYKDNNYNSYDGEVIIPSSVSYSNRFYTVTAIGDSAFYESYVKEVTIPSTITRIGRMAFYTDLLTYITCLATTPPEMGVDCFPHHGYGYNRLPWFEIEGDYDIWDLFLFVPEESFGDYKALNEINHYFSFVIIIGAGQTQAPEVVADENNIVFVPVEGEMHTCSTLYNWTSVGHTSPDTWTVWDDEMCIDYTDPEWGSRVYFVRYAYALDEGKEPSDIVSFEITYSYYEHIYDLLSEEVWEDENNGDWYDFVVDGISYNILDDNSVEVASGIHMHLVWANQYYQYYTVNNAIIASDCYRVSNTNGQFVIPSTVTYEGNTYNVVGITYNAFSEYFKEYEFQYLRNDYDVFPEVVNGTLAVYIEPCRFNCMVLPVSLSYVGENNFDSVTDNIILTGDGAWSGGALDVAVQRLDIASGITAIPGLKVNPREVYCYAKVPLTCDENTFTDYTGTLHVPESSLAAYFTAPYWCNFANIVGDAVELTDLTLNKDSAELLVGEQLTLKIIQPANANIDDITWESSNPSVATVSNDGVVTARRKGECDITVTVLDKRATCHVTVSEILPTSITLSLESALMERDSTLTLTATVLPENATYTTVTWSSSNSSIATVNSQGIVTAHGVGECDITATCKNLTATCHVKVLERFIYITLDQHRASLLPNHILTLTPTVTPVPTDLVVTSSNPSVAAARLANGKVQVVGVSVGTAIIKVASADGNAIADSCFVNVYTEAGDVDGDGFVKIDDVTALIDHLLGSNSSIDVGNADINYDGVVTIADVTELIDCLLSGTSMTTRETFTVNGVSFTMIRVPAGTFMMGATEEQGSEANSWERPVHEVTLSNSYLIGETEVTQELWLAVMGTNPSKHEGSLQKPVENVSWLDCQEFIAQLNALTGCNFRMPTEAEWEYAARGANRSRGYKYAGSNDIADVGNVSSSTTMPVASLQPNELNIYDMSGNVDEWVWDYFGYYTSEPQIDPTGPADGGSDHMYRGGSWYSGANVARVSYRFFRASTFKRGTMGLRLAL